jgi:adenosylmethionine-8-amino-7-oxononanoate aminotransferase
MKNHDLNQLLSENKMKKIFLDFKQMSDFVKDPLIMKKAYGVWYEDIYGKKYLDGVSGIFVVNVGHSNKRVISEINHQMNEICFAPPLHATNTRALELADLLSKITPDGLDTVKLFSGGSEATEASMKLAKQYHKQTGNPTKYKVLSRYESYHGATLGALSATGVAKRKNVFEPLPAGFIHFFPPTCFRCPYKLEYPSCDLMCARIVDDIINKEDPKTISCLIVEPIGNTGGIITPPPEYFPILREICDKNEVLLIFDEIITGFGRTGKMFAAQTFNTTPDIICMGKGMGSGYSPIGAIAFKNEIAEPFYGEKGLEFSHGHTFGGNPLSCAAAIAAIKEIIENNLVKKAEETGKYLWNKLEQFNNINEVGEIRGKGLLVGMEFVKNKDTKEPFQNNFGVYLGKKAVKSGLILRYDPNWVAFAPPLIISVEEIDIMIDIFKNSLENTINVKTGKG